MYYLKDFGQSQCASPLSPEGRLADVLDRASTEPWASTFCHVGGGQKCRSMVQKELNQTCGVEQSGERKNAEQVKVLSKASFLYQGNLADPRKPALCLCPIINSPFGLSCLQGSSTDTTESLNENIRAELKQGQ